MSAQEIMDMMIEDLEEDEDSVAELVQWIPLGVCLAVFLGIIIYLIVDFHGCMKQFENLTGYIKEHPYESIAIIISIYIVLVIFCMPVSFFHIIVAVAYCKVYDSFWKGFAISVPVIFVGMMLGALVVIYLSRYLIADWIKKQIRKSNNKYAKNFKVIDSMFVTNGILFVALLRLMWIPYGLTSYLLGVTSVSVLDYMIGTTAIIVMIVLYVLLGCTIYQAEEDSENEQTRKQTIIILVVEIAFTIVVTIVIGIWATRIFNSRYE